MRKALLLPHQHCIRTVCDLEGNLQAVSLHASAAFDLPVVQVENLESAVGIGHIQCTLQSQCSVMEHYGRGLGFLLAAALAWLIFSRFSSTIAPLIPARGKARPDLFKTEAIVFFTWIFGMLFLKRQWKKRISSFHLVLIASPVWKVLVIRKDWIAGIERKRPRGW